MMLNWDSIAASGSRWRPDAPGFSVVSNEAVEDACGLTGGQHPHDEDPPAPMSISGPLEVSVQPGQISTLLLKAENAEPYVTWEIASAPVWASIYRDGFDGAKIELTPPNNAALVDITATVSAVDALGASATVEIAIHVTV